MVPPQTATSAPASGAYRKKFASLQLFLLACSLVFCVAPQILAQDQTGTDAPVNTSTPAQLQQLVAPIAIYPDALVGQILAAATYPDQVVQADRWLQAHSNLQGPELGKAVDQQPWDMSVKALTQYPAVLANMDRNLAWTSSLGDAYMNDPDALLDAVQTMRQRAKAAGNLNTTAQETVTTDDQGIDVEPANSNVVYLPQYNPWDSYGEPIQPYDDWVYYPGLYYAGPGIFWGNPFDLGFFVIYPWSLPHWRCDWRHHRITHHGEPYASRSRTIVDRRNFNRVQTQRTRPGIVSANAGARSVNPNVGPNELRSTIIRNPTVRVETRLPSPGISTVPQERSVTGVRSTVFSGFNPGGVSRGYSNRGQISVGRGSVGSGFSGGNRGGDNGRDGRR